MAEAEFREPEVQPEVHADRDEADHHRRLPLSDRIECRCEHLHPRVRREPKRVISQRARALLDVVPRHFVILVDHAEDRLREHPQSDARRHREEEHQPHSARQRLAELVAISQRRAAREEWQRDRADRHAKHPERKLHETERIVQPRDRAVLAVRREARVHHHIHLHRARGDDRGRHRAQHFHHSRIAEIKIQPRVISDAPQRGKLDDELQKSADERAPREPEKRVAAKAVIDPPREREPARDAADIEKRRRHRRPAEDIFCVQHPHDLRRERHHEDEGKHHRRELRGELCVLAGEAAREHADELRCKNHPEHGDDAHRRQSESADAVRETPCAPLAFRHDFFREDRDERRGQRALGEKIAQQIRHAECRDEILQRLRAEERIEQDLARKPEQARAQHSRADDGRRPSGARRFLSHSRRPCGDGR